MQEFPFSRRSMHCQYAFLHHLFQLGASQDTYIEYMFLETGTSGETPRGQKRMCEVEPDSLATALTSVLPLQDVKYPNRGLHINQQPFQPEAVQYLTHNIRLLKYFHPRFMVPGCLQSTAEAPLSNVLNPQMLSQRLVQGCTMPTTRCSWDWLLHPPVAPQEEKKLKT